MPGGLCKLRSIIHNKTALLTSTGRSFQSALGVGGTACKRPGADGARRWRQRCPRLPALRPPGWGLLPPKGLRRSDSAAAARLPLPEEAAGWGCEGSRRRWGERGVCGVTGPGCCGDSDLWQQSGVRRAAGSWERGWIKPPAAGPCVRQSLQ